MANITDYKHHKPDETIEGKLDQLTKDLQNLQKEIDDKTKMLTTYQEDIATLTTLKDDASQIKDKYKTAYENFTKDKQAIDSYFTTKNEFITKNLSHEIRTAIDDIMADVQDEIDQKIAKVKGELTDYKNEATSKHDADYQDFITAKKHFEDYEIRQNSIEETLSKLNGFKETIDSIESEGKEGYLLKMYFWIKELHSNSENLKIETPPDFEKTFDIKWREKEGTDAIQRKSNTEKEKAIASYEKGVSDCQSTKDNRIETIKKRIGDLVISDCFKDQTNYESEKQ